MKYASAFGDVDKFIAVIKYATRIESLAIDLFDLEPGF